MILWSLKGNKSKKRHGELSDHSKNLGKEWGERIVKTESHITVQFWKKSRPGDGESPSKHCPFSCIGHSILALNPHCAQSLAGNSPGTEWPQKECCSRFPSVRQLEAVSSPWLLTAGCLLKGDLSSVYSGCFTEPNRTDYYSDEIV